MGLRGLLPTFGYWVMPADGGPTPRGAMMKVRVNVPAGAVTVE